MAKAKISIVGTLEKEPKTNENGTVDLLFKSSMSPAVPKGLTSLEDCFCIAHVAKKTWKKVSDKLEPDSKLLIQGEVKSSINKKGVPFLEVVAFDINLVEKKQEKKADDSAENSSENKEINLKPQNITETKEIKSEEIVTKKPEHEIEIKGLIPIDKIIISEDFARAKPRNEKIQDMLNYINTNSKFDKPVYLNKSYQLIDGYKRYIAAKQLNLKFVPAIFKDDDESFDEKCLEKCLEFKNAIDKKPQPAKAKSKPSEQKKTIVKKPKLLRPPYEWIYNQDDVVEIDPHEITLVEEAHLSAKAIDFGSDLNSLINKPMKLPISVRKIEHEKYKYALVTGIRRYFAAKILDLDKIQAVITDLNHVEYTKANFVEVTPNANNTRTIN